MNLFPRASLLSFVLLLAALLPATAQTPDASGADAPPPGSTVITSDELHSDQANHTSVFDGNVMVVGTSFNMTCDEMKVLFTKDGKVDHIIATGNVIITQPGRVTHSGQCEYFQADDKFVLTDQPMIVDNKNQLSATKITIYRTNQTLATEGRAKIVLINGGFNNSGGADAAAAPLPDNK